MCLLLARFCGILQRQLRFLLHWRLPVWEVLLLVLRILDRAEHATLADCLWLDAD